jgi:hypothetical protein
MTHHPRFRQRSLQVLLSFLTLVAPAWPEEPQPSSLYSITTETGMPHLEENLRYAVTHTKRCLKQSDFPRAFPILEHPALKGCRLGREAREGERISYQLICEGGHGTSGNAIWELGDHQITATLNVKLGGKNMTFYQRLTARAVGSCHRDKRVDDASGDENPPA